MTNCTFPAYVNSGHETLPFCIPFRALTNERYGNLLVAGKTMAQSFLANAATRLHPIEWSTGTAAGVAAAAMSRNGWTSRQAFEQIAEIQALVREKTPIDWTHQRRDLPQGGGDADLEETDRSCLKPGVGGLCWSRGCRTASRYTTRPGAVAQLDRVADFESEGCRFDSYRAQSAQNSRHLRP